MKVITNKWTAGVALAGLSLMSLPAFAQDVEKLDNGVATPTPDAADQTGRLPITVFSGFSHQFEADIKDSSGSFSITRFKAGVRAPVKLADQWALRTSFRYQFDSYDFKDVFSPWHNINTLSVASIAEYQANPTWSYYGGLFGKLSAETKQDLDKGANGGILGGVSYKMNDQFSLGGGLALASQIRDNAVLVPIFTTKWQFAPEWSLEAGLTDVANLGYGAEVKWLLGDQIVLGFGGQYHRSRFRIEGSGASRDGTGQETALTLYADATWHATPKLDVGGFFGIAAAGNLRLESSAEDKLADPDYDPAAIIGIKASFKF